MHSLRNRGKLAVLFAAIATATLLPNALEAGLLGQKCYDDNQTMYRCGSFWQTLTCQEYYSAVYGMCSPRNRSCCNASGKSTELPY